jgi:hypothetical protein
MRFMWYTPPKAISRAVSLLLAIALLTGIAGRTSERKTESNDAHII